MTCSVCENRPATASVMPCSACTPRPFAWVDHEDGRSVLVIGGQRTEEAFNDGRGELVDVAVAINADIESREVTLKGHLNEALAAFSVLRDALRRSAYIPPESIEQALVEERYDRLREFWSHEFVRGDVACGLAFDSGAWQWAVRDLALMLDAVTEANPTERAAIAPFLRAKGMAEAEPQDVVIKKLRAALGEGIRHIASSGGSSTPAFRAMRNAYDDTSHDRVEVEVLTLRHGKLQRMIETLTDEQLNAEMRRRGYVADSMTARALTISVEHIFTDDYAVYVEGNEVRQTGHSLCGLLLEYGGDWVAVTLSTFRSSGTNARSCTECVRRAAEVARPAVTPP